MDRNLHHLSSFRAVAETRSFTRAAEVIGVSQPAVSKQVAELERAIGVTLIERGTRRATLTHAGEVLFEYANRFEAVLSDARAAIADLSAMRRGRLRIGVTPTLATYLLPRTLVYFRSRFPGIDVFVDVRSSADLVDRLHAGTLDVVLTSRPPDGEPPFVYSFMIDTIVPVCAAGHPLAARRRLSLDVLAEERIVFLDGPRRAAGYVERMLRARGCQPAHVLRLPHADSVKQAVLAGLGIGFLPKISIGDELASNRLHRFTLPAFTLRRPYYWVERPLVKRPSTVRAFQCVLKHGVRGTLPPVRR